VTSLSASRASQMTPKPSPATTAPSAPVEAAESTSGSLSRCHSGSPRLHERYGQIRPLSLNIQLYNRSGVEDHTLLVRSTLDRACSTVSHGFRDRRCTAVDGGYTHPMGAARCQSVQVGEADSAKHHAVSSWSPAATEVSQPCRCLLGCFVASGAASRRNLLARGDLEVSGGGIGRLSA
jgi:hypothetical protein